MIIHIYKEDNMPLNNASNLTINIFWMSIFLTALRDHVATNILGWPISFHPRRKKITPSSSSASAAPSSSQTRTITFKSLTILKFTLILSFYQFALRLGSSWRHLVSVTQADGDGGNEGGGGDFGIVAPPNRSGTSTEIHSDPRSNRSVLGFLFPRFPKPYLHLLEYDLIILHDLDICSHSCMPLLGRWRMISALILNLRKKMMENTRQYEILMRENLEP